MGQIQFIGSLLMIGLFTFAIISFAVNFASDNNTSITLEDDSLDTLKTDIQTDLVTFKEETDASISAFNSTELRAGDETTESGGQFKTSSRGIFSTAVRSIKKGWEKIFGSDPAFKYILESLVAFLGILLGLYLYKTWIGKNPD